MRILLAFLCICLAGAAFAQAEMNLLRGTVSIPDGGTDSISNTGFSPFNLTYTIANDGTSDLNLTSMPLLAISNESNCNVTVLNDPVTPVGSMATTTFTLQVSPTSTTGFSFELSIGNNDSNEDPYNITFNGDTAASSSSSSSGSGGKSGCSTGEVSGPELLGWLSLLGLLILGRTIFHKRPTQGDLSRADD